MFGQSTRAASARAARTADNVSSSRSARLQKPRSPAAMSPQSALRQLTPTPAVWTASTQASRSSAGGHQDSTRSNPAAAAAAGRSSDGCSVNSIDRCADQRIIPGSSGLRSPGDGRRSPVHWPGLRRGGRPRHRGLACVHLCNGSPRSADPVIAAGAAVSFARCGNSRSQIFANVARPPRSAVASGPAAIQRGARPSDTAASMSAALATPVSSMCRHSRSTANWTRFQMNPGTSRWATSGTLPIAGATSRRSVGRPRGGRRARDDLHDARQMAGLEEMQAGEPLRPDQRRRDVTDRQTRRVRRDDRGRVAPRFDPPQQLVLGVQVLDDGLDDHVDAVERRACRSAPG